VSVAFIYDPLFLKHNTGKYHPENAHRLRSIINHIETFKEKLLWLKPKPASKEIINLVHPMEHIKKIERYSSLEKAIDGDTQTSLYSYKAALLAAGAGICAIDAFLQKSISSAFAAVRPPGHHATANRAMGFCLFNNIAIAARYAQTKGFEKVLIVDFDVHHGNGTQDIFYEDDSVFYFSSHQYPAYPGSGESIETGSGKGKGYTLNFPLQFGSGDEALVPIYEIELQKTVKSFKPDIILVSAGYDLHELDPLAQIFVTTEGIGRIVSAIMKSADITKLFMLEGGYHIEALGESVALTLKTMLDFDSYQEND